MYWTAISLIVCEGLPHTEAARRMGVDEAQLRDILSRRRTVRLDQPPYRTRHWGRRVPMH